MSESQATSREAGSCRETGEELFRERGFPLGDQMEQLARLAQEPLTLRTTKLVRCHGPHEAMTCGAGIVLLDAVGGPWPTPPTGSPANSASATPSCDEEPVHQWPTHRQASDNP